jgi:hypothetical protein
MPKALYVTALFGILLLAGCGADGRTVVDLAPPGPPPPSEPSTGPLVRQVTVDDTDFRLRDEGDGCVALEISHPGLQTTVERRCFERELVLNSSTSCGWLERPETGNAGFNCHVSLPTVLYGRVTDPAVAYVCQAGGRFLAPDGDGFILEPARAGEGASAHLFTAEGLRYGTPPLSSSSRIYERCETGAPWGSPGIEYLIEVILNVEEDLMRDDITVVMDAGLDRVGASGGTIRKEDTPAYLLLRVPSSSTHVMVSVLIGDDQIFPEEEISFDYDWPEAVSTVIHSGNPCTGSAAIMRVEVGTSILQGDSEAVRMLAAEVVCTG